MTSNLLGIVIIFVWLFSMYVAGYICYSLGKSHGRREAYREATKYINEDES